MWDFQSKREIIIYFLQNTTELEGWVSTKRNNTLSEISTWPLVHLDPNHLPSGLSIGKRRCSCSRIWVQVRPTAPTATFGGSGHPACERSSSLRLFFVIRAQKSVLSFSYCSVPNMLDHDNFGNWACHPVWGDVLG